MSYFLRAYLSHISGINHHGDLGLVSGSKVAASAYKGFRTGLGLAFLIWFRCTRAVFRVVQIWMKPEATLGLHEGQE